MPRERKPVETLRDLRRAQIVAAARAIVAKDGIEALTFSALEAKLSFTRGVITYHFENKDEIVLAVLDSAVAEIDQATMAAVTGSATFEERVRAVVRANVRGFVERVEAAKVLLSFWGRLGSDARMRARNAELYAGYRQATTMLLAMEAPAGVDVEGLSTVVVGIVIGIATQWFFDPKSVDVERAIAEAEASVVARLAKVTSSSRSPRRRGSAR